MKRRGNEISTIEGKRAKVDELKKDGGDAVEEDKPVTEPVNNPGGSARSGSQEGTSVSQEVEICTLKKQQVIHTLDIPSDVS